MRGEIDNAGAVAEMLREDTRRQQENAAAFNPLTGEGAPGRRFEYDGRARGMGLLRLPMTMKDSCVMLGGANPDDFERERCRHDFPYWAAKYVKVKNKEGGEDVPFVLTRPQRRLVEMLEGMRTAGKPIRLILLKARQWGGSTTVQIYMAWLQLMILKGLNSLIISQQQSASYTIKDMFDRMIADYPLSMLHEPGEEYKPGEAKMQGVGRTGTIFRVPQRNCKITIGSAERPDSCRGGDYTLVHCSEVGIWKATAGKTPEDIVRSACSGILLRPLTMIVYESTANGVGNFFHREYQAAKSDLKKSQFTPLFISWYDIDLYRIPFDGSDEEEHLRSREAFAAWLLAHRGRTTPLSEREAPGSYLWMLWDRGATLEALHWYIAERAKYSDPSEMASEYPSDDVEAFANSGQKVFDRLKVEALRKGCRLPMRRGELLGKGDKAGESLVDLRFVDDSQGSLEIWEEPESSGWCGQRYLAVVDIGGRSRNADWSVVAVFDRAPMAEGKGPKVVAQWRGHTDMDLLAWKAMQIASYYAEALLVIESNTLETHDEMRIVDGDQSFYILNQVKECYPNLYARRQSEDEIAQHAPVKYGFHTNVSTKPMVISALVKAIRELGYEERDERCIDEYVTYERRQNGSYGATVGHHDDLLMTRAIGVHIAFSEMSLPMRRDATCNSRYWEQRLIDSSF